MERAGLLGEQRPGDRRSQPGPRTAGMRECQTGRDAGEPAEQAAGEAGQRAAGTPAERAAPMPAQRKGLRLGSWNAGPSPLFRPGRCCSGPMT
jgi:hypothetical protein